MGGTFLSLLLLQLSPSIHYWTAISVSTSLPFIHSSILLNSVLCLKSRSNKCHQQMWSRIVGLLWLLNRTTLQHFDTDSCTLSSTSLSSWFFHFFLVPYTLFHQLLEYPSGMVAPWDCSSLFLTITLSSTCGDYSSQSPLLSSIHTSVFSQYFQLTFHRHLKFMRVQSHTPAPPHVC